MYPSKPIWTRINKPPAQYPWLSDDVECEVCVIGGGITGAIAAARLAELAERGAVFLHGLVGLSGFEEAEHFFRRRCNAQIRAGVAVAGDDFGGDFVGSGSVAFFAEGFGHFDLVPGDEVATFLEGFGGGFVDGDAFVGGCGGAA